METQKVTRTFVIINELGLHARAAAAFVKTASRFKSQIRVYKNSTVVDGKSIMGVLMLAAAKGSVIKIEAEGIDAEKAIEELGQLINDRFGEER